MSIMFLALTLLVSVSFDVGAVDGCFDTHEDAAKNFLDNIKEFNAIDLNKNGVSEYTYLGECWMRGCSSRVIFNFDGCYKVVYSGTSELQFVNDLPVVVKERLIITFQMYRNIQLLWMEKINAQVIS